MLSFLKSALRRTGTVKKGEWKPQLHFLSGVGIYSAKTKTIDHLTRLRLGRSNISVLLSKVALRVVI